MPLRDHFRPPVQSLFPWASLHGTWATCIMGQLNQTLPVGYIAQQRVYLGSHRQVDVGALERSGEKTASEGNGAVATAVWAPPEPPLVAEIDLASLDTIEVRVLLAEDLRLVGAIELVSPANKDRAGHRQAFVAKVAGYLQQGVGVVVVDVVTERHGSLHEDLMRLLDLGEEKVAGFSADLYAVAYRLVLEVDNPRLEAWPDALAVGAGLPRLPLWIGPELAVPLDLESSYVAACRLSRLPERDEDGLGGV